MLTALPCLALQLPGLWRSPRIRTSYEAWIRLSQFSMLPRMDSLRKWMKEVLGIMKNLKVREDMNEVKGHGFTAFGCKLHVNLCLSKVLFGIFTVCGVKYFFVESIVFFNYHLFLQKKKKRLLCTELWLCD